MQTLRHVLREGGSAALSPAKQALTHFITLQFLSFYSSLRSILEDCRRQASRHTCIYFLLLFIHGLAPPAAVLRQIYLPHKFSFFDIPHIIFMGHYLKGGRK